MWKEEVLYRSESTSRAHKRAMQKTEQKNLSWMKKLIWKPTGPGDVMTKFCAIICSTAKACRLLDQHKTFLGCDVDSEVLATAEADLFLPFASQVLDLKFDISGSGKMEASNEGHQREDGCSSG